MSDEGYMSLALSLARRRKGLTHPNPTVGCVVVRKGEVVGLGHHEGAGHPHAEVVALEEAGNKASGATLYVTLEPCVHFGRTPPCTDAIERAGIKRVVIATPDPNPLVRGKGIHRLRQKGIEVKVGVCEEEAKALNEDFFTYVTSGRPYVTLKLAQTLDGKTATPEGKSKWITSRESRKLAHRLREEASAVLVGINTVIEDDPALTVRYVPSNKKVLRIVIDPQLDIPPTAKLTNTSESPTMVVFSRRNPSKEEELLGKGVQLLYMERIDISSLLEELRKREVIHLLVEGGAYTVSRFIKEGLWDRMVLFQAPKIMGSGISLTDIGVKGIENILKVKLGRELRIGQERVFELLPYKEEKSLRW